MSNLFDLMLHRIDWNAVYGIAGIVAFFVSGFLAIREALKSKVKLKSSNAEIYVYSLPEKTGDVFCFIPHTLTNRSSLPISILTAALVGIDGSEYFAPQDSSVILGVNLEHIGRASIVSRDFPVNIQPQESIRLNLYIRLRQQDHLQLGLPPIFALGDPSPSTHTAKGSAHHVCIRYYTPRKPVTLHIDAPVCDPNEKRSYLQRRAKVSHVFESAIVSKG